MPQKTKNTPKSNSHTLRIGARCLLLVGLISVMSLLAHFQFTELPDNTGLVIAAFIVVVKYHLAICRRFEVLTPVNMEIIVLRYVTPCNSKFHTYSYLCTGLHSTLSSAICLLLI